MEQQSAPAPTPSWFRKKGPFGAMIDMNDLGYPQVEIRDPPGAKYFELAQVQEKHSCLTVHGMAAEFEVYVVGVDRSPFVDPYGDGKVTKDPGPIPDPGSKLLEWKSWVASTPSRVLLRLINGRNQLNSSVDQGN